MKRSRSLVCCLLFWTLVAPAGAESLTIATYNVENYLSTHRHIDGRFRPDYPKTERSKAALRAVIRELDADVLALQEVGGAGHLRELRLDLAAEGLDYPHALVLPAADEARQLAVLSRKEFLDTTGHVDLLADYFGEPVPVRRGLLEVTVAAGEGGLTLFVLHLKSRLTERPDDPGAAQLRAAEAVAVRDRVLERCPDPATTPFLVLGDFNDLRPNRPLRAVLDRGKTAIAEWVPAVDSRDHSWTHYYARNEVYSRVDHILASPAAVPMIRRAWIVDTPETALASDHRPVAVTLEIH
ncbi:MAG: endonuclease/exonuclease/phosphatase family protein [Verrucomicrobiota bacterium]